MGVRDGERNRGSTRNPDITALIRAKDELLAPLAARAEINTFGTTMFAQKAGGFERGRALQVAL
jgi:hypothetical protein